jgi:hypothetical protein
MGGRLLWESFDVTSIRRLRTTWEADHTIRKLLHDVWA